MRLLGLPLVAALAVTGFAQTGVQKRPMTFADLQAMKRVSDPQISPSGKWVLFSVTDVSLEKNSNVNHLWAVPIGGNSEQGTGNRERQVTAGGGETNGRFSPDGKWVMYSSKETGTGQIWMAPWDDAAGVMGVGHQVTSLETEADGGVWTPDSKHFLFVSEVYPECESHAAMGVGRNEEEVSCNALKDSIQAKSPVKAMLFTSLLYRHWDHYQGAKRSHIFYGSVEAGAGAPTDLTPASVIGDHVAPTYFVGGGLPGYAISPDGKEVAYVVNLDKVPAESTNNDIYTVQVGAEPGTAKKVSTSPGSDDGPAYSPDGKWLAWRSQARNGFESDLFTLVVMDRATGRFVPLNWNLQVFDADGNITSSKFDLWVNEFVWSDDSDHIYFVSDDHGEAPIFEAHVSGQGIGRMGKVAGEWQDLNFHLINGMVHVIGTKVQIDRPAEIYNYNLLKIDDSVRTFTPREPYVPQPGEHIIVIGRAKPQPVQDEQLTHLNDAVLGQLELPKMDSFWFEGAADTKVEGFIIRPPGFDARKKYPVKFLMHGGPQTAWGDAWSYRWNPELMAADGYVVVMINRRGSTGYGQKFVDEVSGDWGGKAYVDLMKGLDYAEKTYPFIDKERECALGASYGGFMANWVLTHTDRFKCIVTHDGMYNPQSAFGTTEEDWFNEWEFRPLEAANSQQGTGNRKGGKAGLSATAQKRAAGRDDNVVGGGEVEQTKAAYPWDYFDKSNEDDPFRKWSPMLHIKNAKTPTLVIHGQRDYRLDVSEGLQLFDSLQMLGVPSEMLYFQDEGHWVLKPKDSELWYRTVGDWCDRWTKSGKYAAQGPGSRAQGSGKSEAQ